jgi:hypothetical protein
MYPLRALMEKIKASNKYAYTDELEAINRRSKELGLNRTLPDELFDLEVINPFGQNFCVSVMLHEHAAGVEVPSHLRTWWTLDLDDDEAVAAEEEPPVALDMEPGSYEALPELDEETVRRALDLRAGMEEWSEEDGSISSERLKQLIEDARRR